MHCLENVNNNIINFFVYNLAKPLAAILKKKKKTLRWLLCNNHLKCNQSVQRIFNNHLCNYAIFFFNCWIFQASMTLRLLETKPNGLQIVWNLSFTKCLTLIPRYSKNLGSTWTMNPVWFLMRMKWRLTMMKTMTAVAVTVPLATLFRKWSVVASMAQLPLDLTFFPLHLSELRPLCQMYKLPSVYLAFQ